MVKGVETIIEKVILPKYPFILKFDIKEWTTPSYYGDTRFALTFKIKMSGDNIHIYQNEIYPKTESVLRMLGFKNFTTDEEFSSIAPIFFATINASISKNDL